MKKLYLETFGCQMNVVDSEQIVAKLGLIDYRLTDDLEQADLILMNTCSIREKAERKVYGHLGRFKPLKDRKPDLIIGVGGCVAQQEGQKMLDQVKHLDLVFGTHNIHKLPELVQQVEERRQRGAETEFLDCETRQNLFPERTESDDVTRFVTIMQGCNNFCAFCIVPYVRGREISRPSEQIIAEVETLVNNGAREITLLGQNVNSYGVGIADELSFPQLLTRLDQVEGLQRLRFATSHPKDMTNELIDCFGTLDKLCHQVHLPVQSGSDRVLKAMNRGYSAADYLRKVERLKKQCPDIRLTTDLIVGFPNETEEDFQATLDMVERVGYADAYTFIYSPRTGTKAAEMPDEHSRLVKQERFDRLLDLQHKNSESLWQQDLGKVFPVLVEGSAKREGQVFGRTEWTRIVNFPGSPELIGTTVPVRISEVLRTSHLGELVQD